MFLFLLFSVGLSFSFFLSFYLFRLVLTDMDGIDGFIARIYRTKSSKEIEDSHVEDKVTEKPIDVGSANSEMRPAIVFLLAHSWVDLHTQ